MEKHETPAFIQSGESMPDLSFNDAIDELKRTGCGVVCHPDLSGEFHLSKLGALVWKNRDGIEVPWPDNEDKNYRENKWFHIPF